MRLRVSFVPADTLDRVADLRAAHLRGLPEAQAPLLDTLVEEGRAFLIHAGADTCGYLIVGGEGERTLLEFYLRPPFWVFGEVVFLQARRALGITRALVQQYDALLLSSCIAHQSRVRSLGLLTRDYVRRSLPKLPGLADRELSPRPAVAADLPAIRAVDQQVFTHPERLAALVEAGQLLVYERDGGLVGFGILRPAGVDGRAVELGIAVDRPYRARGYAVFMLAGMVAHCLARGLQPIAGNAEDNRASRHMGERVGLVARYRLLELTF